MRGITFLTTTQEATGEWVHFCYGAVHRFGGPGDLLSKTGGALAFMLWVISPGWGARVAAQKNQKGQDPC